MARVAALPHMNTAMLNTCLALEIGGTRLGAALVSQTGEVATVHRADTPPGGGEAILKRLIVLATQAIDEAKTKPSVVGISSAGVIDAERGIVAESGDTLPGWRGTRLAEPVSAHFGCPAFAANDAQCALEGELWKGAHAIDADAPVVLLTLGTGLGGAWAIDGKIVRGRHLHAGHFGNSPRFHPLLRRVARVEETVSGGGLAVLHRALHGTDARFVDLGGPELMQACAQGETQAFATVANWSSELAALIGDMRWTLDPALILLGGGVIGSREVWWPMLTRVLHDMQVDTPVVPASLGNTAGLVGAAHQAWSRLP
jgi:glucokinase